MEAMILCGGLGTRLREETEFRPKPMVNIGEYPILWHIMKRYSAYGVKRFILCLGYKGDYIRDYFMNYRNRRMDFSVKLASGDVIFDRRTDIEDWEVVLAETGEHSLTGSRVARAMRHVLGQRFFLTYGDGVSDIDFQALIRHHEESRRAATLSAVLPSSRFGQINIKQGAVEVFAEKPQVDAGNINGGFMILEKQALLRYLPADPWNDTNCSLEGHVLEQLARDGQLAAYEHRGFWQCMDTHREMEILNRMYEKGDAPWLIKDGMPIFGGVSGSSLRATRAS